VSSAGTARPSWDPAALPGQSGKTFVVTGGNAGIGYFVSEQLARAGGRIILASRSAQKADAAAASIRRHAENAEVDFVPLDLSSLKSIRNAAKGLASLGPIDVLINNAGATTGSRRRQTTEDGLEFVVGSNAFGPYALTALAFGSLKPDARIVSLGSLATRMVKLEPADLQSERRFNFFRAYAFSKHAMHAFAFELQRRLAASGSGIESLLAHPGSAVDLLSERRAGINDGPVKPLDVLSAIISQGKDRGAWPVVRAAIDPDARGGEFYGPNRSVRGRPVLLDPVASSASEEFGAEFWRQAEDATGIRFAP
jgi:NAD(P)-dependent dehydrogenase (short-subunit alcohol dehydrogenase family)